MRMTASTSPTLAVPATLSGSIQVPTHAGSCIPGQCCGGCAPVGPQRSSHRHAETPRATAPLDRAGHPALQACRDADREDCGNRAVRFGTGGLVASRDRGYGRRPTCVLHRQSDAQGGVMRGWLNLPRAFEKHPKPETRTRHAARTGKKPLVGRVLGLSAGFCQVWRR